MMNPDEWDARCGIGPHDIHRDTVQFVRFWIPMNGRHDVVIGSCDIYKFFCGLMVDKRTLEFWDVTISVETNIFNLDYKP